MSTKKELEEKIKELETELKNTKESLLWKERAQDRSYNELYNINDILTGFGIAKEAEAEEGSGYKAQYSTLQRLSMLISLLTKKGE